jgi:LuxR family quorum-sensing system transcriptional regulator SolR
MEQWKEEYTHAFLNSKNEQALFDYFSSKVAEIGFEYCSFGMALPLPVTSPKFVIFNTYPTAWWDLYQRKGYLQIDPTVRHGLISNTPILWNAETFASAPEMWEDAQAHGLRHGWAQPAQDLRGTTGMISLSRSEQTLNKSELEFNGTRMQQVTQMLLVGITDFVLPKLLPESLAKLTPREKEVLRWTADGKTSYEIGRILIISIATVNFHINNAISKLDATNKTQAVVKAALLGLLF